MEGFNYEENVKEKWYVVTSSKKAFGSSTSREDTLESENIQEKSLPGDGENTIMLIHKREREREGEGVTGATVGKGVCWEGVFWGALWGSPAELYSGLIYEEDLKEN